VQGCTIQSAYFIDAYGLTEGTFNIDGLTVLDPNIIGLKTIEMLVDLKRLGIGLSRNSIFKKPQDFSEQDYHNVRKMFKADKSLL
jgi:hypothetical protein